MEHDVQSEKVEPTSNDEHCVCGALLARWVSTGLELKCRRCKRIVTIAFPESATAGKLAP
ncbi:MAG TPA: hypothetical protein VHC69_25260 [Polyangiaceae bacterium]|nr:hypothetical protein [Polyangiaceae bacterium]